MSNQSRFKSGVPAPNESPGNAQSFIAGAPGKSTYPWQHQRVRDDVSLAFNIEISERLKLKIDWLAFNTKTPKKVIAKMALEAHVNAELRRLGIEE